MVINEKALVREMKEGFKGWGYSVLVRPGDRWVFNTPYWAVEIVQGIIDRDTAIREKKKLLKEYESYKFVDQMGKQWVQIIKDTETARSEYRKSRTIENADKLLIAIDGGDYGKRVS